jgi:sugar/nucleoside kinase (ribokinase family)
MQMRQGSDVPGRISRLPGGVALNIARTLAQFDMRPTLLSFVGQDAEGDELLDACGRMALETRHVHRSDALPTDTYMAVEGANGVIAAIADAHSLEAAGDAILTPLLNGDLGSPEAPFSGRIALDGNLTLDLLTRIATDPAFARADLRVAPASPGKAERLKPFLTHGRATLYVNLEEAGLLCGTEFTSSTEAAQGLLDHGAQRALVTDGAKSASEGGAQGLFTHAPPPVHAVRVTGAGDTFMAAHIAAESRGHGPDQSLSRAVRAAATFVAGDTPT